MMGTVRCLQENDTALTSDIIVVDRFSLGLLPQISLASAVVTTSCALASADAWALRVWQTPALLCGVVPDTLTTHARVMVAADGTFSSA
jgi:phosphohistidine swiveling domain-containing protein